MVGSRNLHCTGADVTTPPRSIECWLEALGAEPGFRDSVLGDLAEEFVSRVDSDGENSADNWYRREALRVAPHLLWSWMRRLRVRGAVQLVGVMVSSYVTLLMLGLLVGGIGYGVLRILGLPTEYHLPWGNAAAASMLLAGSLVFGTLISALSGYIASLLGNEAPLASAVAYAVVWGLIEVVVAMLASGFPLWYRCAMPVVVVIGTTAGGMLRVNRLRAPSSVAVPS
jgi:hypothetical protein